MKQYEELQIMISYMGNMDIITWSNGQDNDTSDDVWFEN